LRYFLLLACILVACPETSDDESVPGPGSCLCYQETDSDSGIHGVYECTTLGEDEEGTCEPEVVCTWHEDKSCEEAEAEREGN
jgi:hypothetical protein